MKNETLAKIDLDISEVMALIDYHLEMSDLYSQGDPTTKTVSKLTFKELDLKHRKRAVQLNILKDNIWPK